MHLPQSAYEDSCQLSGSCKRPWEDMNGIAHDQHRYAESDVFGVEATQTSHW